MVDQKPKHSIFFYYMASVMAAMNSEFVTYPLDLIKTRLQIQGEIGAAKLGGGPKRGMLSTGIGIAREEVYSGNRMISYMYFRESIFKANKGEYFPLWKSVLCGASAGAYAQFIANPADLFKVQMQMEGKRKLMGLPPRVSGLVDAFQQAWRAGGIRVLWKGAVPNTQRAALVNIGDLSAYDVSKRFLLEKTTLADATLLHVIASLIAGFTAAVIATPVDVIKTRVMNQPVDAKGYGLLYKSTRHCFKLAVKQEGVWSLYKGFIPHWIRLGPWALIFWVSYEKILHVMGARSF